VEGYLLGEDIYPSPNLRQEIAMEKTIKYLLQEAYVNGYNDARESVAKEIETLADGIEPKNNLIAQYAPVDANEILWRAIAIARGNK
jgi:hypothetical protein